MFFGSGVKSRLGFGVFLVLIFLVSSSTMLLAGPTPSRSGTGAIATIAALIPDDPADKQFPDLFVGDLEVVEAVMMYSHNKEVPGSGGQTLDKDGTKYIIAHWICDEEIRRPALFACTNNVSAPTNVPQGELMPLPALQISRSISNNKVIPGSALSVRVTIRAHQDSKMIGLFDFVPEGWALTEQGGNIEFFTDMQAEESRSFVYSVVIPTNAKPGYYSINGRLRSATNRALSVIGGTSVEVVSKKSALIFSAVAGANGFIDDLEILTAIQLWQERKAFPGIRRTLSDEEIAELLRFWEAGMYVDPKLLLQLYSAQRYTPTSRNWENTLTTEISAEFYDLQGRLLWRTESTHPALDENWESYSRQLANGIYITVLRARGPSGQIVKQEVKKILVLK